jgi:hypothetical protein
MPPRARDILEPVFARQAPMRLPCGLAGARPITAWPVVRNLRHVRGGQLLQAAGHQVAHHGAVNRRDIGVTADGACARAATNELVVREPECAPTYDRKT